jgi:hypothetical protein
MPNRTSTAAALVAVALLGAACGGPNDDGSDGDPAIAHPTAPDELVLRVDVGGGFLPVEYHLAQIPGVSIYGDGRMIMTGPVIEIYPAPALPNLQVRQLTEEALQAILRAARDAGLMEGDASYGFPCVTDLPTTTFTLSADGRTSVVSAYALGFEEGAGTCEGVDEAARADLVAFQSALGHLEGLVPAGSVGAEEPYVPGAMRVYVLPYRGDPELPQEPVAWPVTGSMGTFGHPAGVAQGARCGIVAGPDLVPLLEAAAGANQLTPWTSGGREHAAIFRPLLPDEHGCEG